MLFKNKSLPLINDLTGITTVVATPQLMVVHPSLPARRCPPTSKPRFMNDGFETMTSASPVAYAAFRRQKIARWAKVAKAATMKAE
jgi:hypothetical protein